MPRHGRGTRASRKESFGAVGGGWMAAQRGQGLSIHKRPQQTSKWRENNVNQVSLCWRRKVQICKGRRPGRCWTGIRGTAVNSWLSIQLIRCRDTYGRMREARAYTHACASCLCPRRGPESSDTQGQDEGRQRPGLRLQVPLSAERNQDSLERRLAPGLRQRQNTLEGLQNGGEVSTGRRASLEELSLANSGTI